MERYEPKAIEARWQRVWDEAGAFAVPNPERATKATQGASTCSRCSLSVGRPPHGACLNYTMGDVVTHFPPQRLSRPATMGFDSFGLPAENAAIQEGGHPREITDGTSPNRPSDAAHGLAIDWDREASAHEPLYYRWTQWLFLRFLERDLAYRADAP